MFEFDKLYNDMMETLSESIFIPLTTTQVNERKNQFFSKLDKNDYDLSKAAEIGWYDRVRELLKQGTDPKANNSQALRYASYNGHLDIVKLLIPLSDPKADDSEALRYASKYGHLDIVKLLIPLSDPKAYDSYALRYASLYGHFDIVKLLIPLSDPKAVDSYALRAASFYGYLDIVKLLIPLSDPKAYDSEALRYASRYGHLDIVKLLIPLSDPKIVEELGLVKECINESILADILGVMMQALASALRKVFGVDGEKLYKGITETEQKTDNVLVYNKLAKNFNDLIGEVKLNARYDSNTRPYFDIFINLVPLDSKSSEDYFKIGDMKKPLADRTPVQIPFKIIGYGVKIADDKNAKKDASFQYEVKDVPAVDMSSNDMEEMVQTMFDESVARNRRLGIKLTVETVNPKVESISTADIDFDKSIYKKDTTGGKDDPAILDQMKKYVIGSSNTIILPLTKDELKTKGIPANPAYLYVQPTIMKDIPGIAGVLVKKGTTLTSEKQYTKEVIMLINKRLEMWKEELDDKFKDRELKYGLKSVKLLEYPKGSNHIKVVGGWTYLKFEWVKEK